METKDKLNLAKDCIEGVLNELKENDDVVFYQCEDCKSFCSVNIK